MIQDLLEFYMGKNTPQRQEFIIKNLKIEADIIEEEEVARAEVTEAAVAA
jgi:topoisomerase-4 subunit B